MCIDYDTSINLWNHFMVDSGIRKNCQENCKGNCCGEVTCGNKCESSLSCVSYICSSIMRPFGKVIQNMYEEYNREVYNSYRSSKTRWGHGKRGLINNAFTDPTHFFDEMIKVIKKNGRLPEEGDQNEP